MAESSNDTRKTCPRCSGSMTHDGLCLRCAGALAFGTEDLDASNLPAALGKIRSFGDYELLEEIARGGMGVVYRALQRSLNREVAVKLMLHGALATTQEVERFQAEAKAAAALRHPGIISIHEVGESDGQHYFSMDLVIGRNLDELTRSGPVDAILAATLLIQVARAVDYAHKQGVLHRDIKPSNVLVDGENHTHITDFGLARHLHVDATLTQAGQVMGTPGFMSPEQASGVPGAAGIAADIYGLGALLYHLLTARPPFVGPTLVDTLRQVAEKEPISPRLLTSSVPRDIETISLKALAKVPSKRYASAGDLADDLERFLKHEPILARPIGRWERSWRWSKRNPTVAALGGAVASLLVLVSIGSTIVAARMSKARERESELRKESEARLRQGDKLIEFMMGDLSERLVPVGRIDVLDTTIVEVNKFYAEVPAEKMTPEGKRNQARAFMQMANIRVTQGRFPEAYDNFEKSIQAYKVLIASYAENLTWNFELTRILNDLGIAHLQQSEWEKGAEVLEECLRVRQGLLLKQPDNAYWLSSMGGTAQNLSLAYRELKNFDRAGELLRIAEAAQRQWMKVEPKSTKPRQRLATVLGSLGAYLVATDHLQDGMKAYEEKLRILNELVKEEPKNSDFRFELALGLGQIAEHQLNQEHYSESQASLEESLRLFELLLVEDRGNNSWKAVMNNTLLNLGMTYRWQGKPREAVSTFERLWALAQEDVSVLTTYPKWAQDCGHAVTNAAEVLREMAVASRKAGNEAEAQAHEAAAVVWDERFKTLPK